MSEMALRILTSVTEVLIGFTRMETQEKWQVEGRRNAKLHFRLTAFGLSVDPKVGGQGGCAGPRVVIGRVSGISVRGESIERDEISRREHEKEMKRGARIDPRRALLLTNQAQ